MNLLDTYTSVDPFDRILIAQAVAEGFSLVTSDGQIAAYPVRVIW